jgi:hypothetical protein
LPLTFPARPDRPSNHGPRDYTVAYLVICDCGSPKASHTFKRVMLPTIGKGLSQDSLWEQLQRPDVAEAAMYRRDGGEWVRMNEADAFWPEGVEQPTVCLPSEGWVAL